MQSGNLPSKITIKMDYLNYSKPPFKQTDSEKRIIFRPHQTKSLFDPHKQYQPLNLECSIKEIDCVCIKEYKSDIFDNLIDTSGIKTTLLWIDPRFLRSECIASFIFSWNKFITAAQNVALAIMIPKGMINNKSNVCYELWNVDVSGPSYDVLIKNPIWYPSLARDSESLHNASQILKPYDTFPLVEFPEIVTQMGEKALTNHAYLLEHCNARTRNFIFLDILHPDRAFTQFIGTLEAMPKMGSSVFQPVITPGGSIRGYMIALLSGVLTKAYFLTPKEENIINSNAEMEGIMIVRKCI